MSQGGAMMTAARRACVNHRATEQHTHTHTYSQSRSFTSRGHLLLIGRCHRLCPDHDTRSMWGLLLYILMLDSVFVCVVIHNYSNTAGVERHPRPIMNPVSSCICISGGLSLSILYTLDFFFLFTGQSSMLIAR